MTKKSTDANNILGAARRAADVPRPTEDTPAITPSTSPEKRVNVALRPQTHKRLKLLSVQRDTTVQDLVEQLLQDVLAKEER